MDDELYIGFGEPGRQSRITVAFRALLALPHVVVLFVLALVAIPLVIFGWFAALILGRLPRWIATYLMSLIAYSVRVNAYWHMLAREFPPFAFSVDAEYPVTVKIEATNLSRLKVFFRWLLVIPAWFVAGSVSFGLILISPIIWLVTLVLGRMPRPFFDAGAAVMRYQVRLSAYLYLVTDVYPRRLFGDPEFQFVPEGFRLSLSRGAKWVLGLIVALGIANYIAGFVVPIALLPENTALVNAENRLESASRTYVSSAQQCGTLRCVQTAERAWGESFNEFASSLSRISFSGSNADLASILAHDARQIGQTIIAASKAKTAVGNDREMGAAQRLLRTFEADAKTLLGHGL